MNAEESNIIQQILRNRFGHDTLLSLATVDNGIPSVRTVNSYYENKAFYIITNAQSSKMKHIKNNPNVAVCGDWFTAHGIGEDLGYIFNKENIHITEKLREVFSSWYNNGHINESDQNTCILCIHLTDGTLYSHGTRYDIDFNEL